MRNEAAIGVLTGHIIHVKNNPKIIQTINEYRVAVFIVTLKVEFISCRKKQIQQIRINPQEYNAFYQ